MLLQLDLGRGAGYFLYRHDNEIACFQQVGRRFVPVQAKSAGVSIA